MNRMVMAYVLDTGDGELPSLQKMKRLYTLRQKKRVVAVARQESITAASMVGYQIRWYMYT